ncbi:hypothetical protein J1N35_025741 [Gossypium stocksii]|uniref:Uncharacterized protein n=1 Tax=Gossypium stocksii TaxID=47602 RepID=A0A9D3ZYJ9_9ROSI|nr:hypothetical protein J1N35_025741 [Gossypium stocksii]
MIATPMPIRVLSEDKPHSVTPLLITKTPTMMIGMENRNVKKLMNPSGVLLKWNDMVWDLFGLKESWRPTWGGGVANAALTKLLKFGF